MKVVEVGAFDYDPWNGKLLIWEPPEPHEVYCIGVDPSEGLGGDNSVCEVIKMGTIKHPDIQVAEFACNWMDPVDFASVVKTIGDFYADSEGMEAFCTLEINAPCGDVMINELRNRLDYGNLYIKQEFDKVNNIYTNRLGWSTNKATRPKLIARGLHAFIYGDLIVNSEYLLAEMADFQRDLTLAKARAVSGKHDDRIMALLMGYFGAHSDEWVSGDDIGEQRRAAEKSAVIQEIREEAKIESKPGHRVDYQNRAISFAKMQNEAEEQYFDD